MPGSPAGTALRRERNASHPCAPQYCQVIAEPIGMATWLAAESLTFGPSMTEFFGRDVRVNALINTGHFLSHFYLLCVPLMFLSWQQSFGVTFAELGLSSALMAAATGLLQ